MSGTPSDESGTVIEATSPKDGFGNKFAAFAYATKSDIILIIIATICAIGQGSTQPLAMLFLGDSVNSMGAGDMGSAFDTVIRNFAILAAVGFVLGTIAAALFEICAERQIRLIKRHYVHGVLRQEIAFYDTKDPGSLASEIEQSCVTIRDGIGMKFGHIWQFFAQFVAGYVVALCKGWQLALVMSVIIPVIAIAMGAAMTAMRNAAKKSEEAYGSAGSLAEEIIPSMRTIAAFALEGHFIDRFNTHIAHSERADKRANTFKGLSFGAIFLILVLSYALGWWYGTKQVTDALVASNGTDLTTGGAVITVFSAIMIASFSLGQVGPNVSSLVQASGAAVTVRELCERTSPCDPFSEMGVTANRLDGKIEFKNVTFAYPTRPDRQIYKDVSFTINAGETVALVGASGCGKSTVIQLMERFYDPTGGDILVDGRELHSYNLHWLRAQCALVSQEPKLFCTTIRENIRCGAADPEIVSEDEIIAAARAANAHGFISFFVNGYDTEVGQGGGLLSGGQKQRVAIARAILRDPSILILDEATSALDNESEKIVQKALDDLVKAKRRTTIIIAHRLTTIRTADKIVVFDNPDGAGSRVVEAGTHEELVKLPDGIYKTLVNAQQVISSTDEDAKEKLRDRLEKAAVIQNALSSHLSGNVAGNDVLRALRSHNSFADAAVARILSNVGSKGAADFHALHSGAILSPTNRVPDRAASKVPKREVSKLIEDTLMEPLAHPRTRRLWKFAWVDWPYMLVGTVASIGAGAVFPLISLIMAEFLGLFFAIDPSKTAQENADWMMSEGSSKALLFVYLAIAAAIVIFGQQECWGRMGEGLVATMRKNVFANMVHQDMAFFDNTDNNAGHLSAVLSADCALTRGITGENLSIILQNVFTLAIAIIIAFSGEARLAGVTLAAFSLLVPAVYFQSKLSGPASHKKTVNDSSKKVDSQTTQFVVNEIVCNLRTIAAYNLQEWMEQQYETALSREFGSNSRMSIVSGIASGLATGLQGAANAIAFWYAGYLMKNEGELDVETVMRTVMVMMNAGGGLGRASAFATDSRKAKTACKNIFSILDRSSPVDARDDFGDKSTPIKGNLALEDVTFRYPGRPHVSILKGVDFKVEAGQSVALVGASGSGKSTVIQFLERFYDVRPSMDLKIAMNKADDIDKIDLSGIYDGTVRVEDQNILNYNVSYLRSKMGLVGQEPVLFTGTIRENIAHGKAGASEGEIKRAARMANAADFIEKLPEQYDTQVGRGGGQMSGGQKQRIAIARALVRDPAILLFDEATSALDPESEAIVQKTLDDLLSGEGGGGKKTSITIAHRLSTVRNSDLIIVFAPRPGVGSHIIERGTHDELMRLPNGVYKNLVEISSR